MEIWDRILEIRGKSRRFYQKYERFITPVLKFVYYLICALTISSNIGFNKRLASIGVSIGLGLLGAFLPSVVMIILFITVVLIHIYSESVVLAAFAVLVLVVLFCFMARLSEKYGYAMVGIPVLYSFHMPCLIPMLLGLTASPIAILPTTCGIIIYYMLRVFKAAAITENVGNLDDVLELYIGVMDEFVGNKEMYATIAVFALIITAMWIIRKLQFEFVFEISVAVGGLINMIGFLVVYLVLGVGDKISSMFFGTICATLVVFAAQFFMRVLNYAAVEEVQFEDDDYYYYVKAIPKVDALEDDLAKPGQVEYVVNMTSNGAVMEVEEK